MAGQGKLDGEGGGARGLTDASLAADHVILAILALRHEVEAGGLGNDARRRARRAAMTMTSARHPDGGESSGESARRGHLRFRGGTLRREREVDYRIGGVHG